jgi:diguanylate cyclase (GGDEF)-like protein
MYKIYPFYKPSADLSEDSIRDPITGLFNWCYMEEALEREIRRSERSWQPIGVIMLAIDQYHQLTAKLNKPEIDKVLAELGSLLQHSVRGGDMICRYGSDDFLLVLPEASLEVTQFRAEQIQQRVRELNTTLREHFAITLSLSLGVAAFPEHGLTSESILSSVLNCLKSAQADGGNQVISPAHLSLELSDAAS